MRIFLFIVRMVLLVNGWNILLISNAWAQESPTYIVLKAENLSLNPREFYIKQVLDSRKYSQNIGHISLVTGEEKEPIDIRGGVKEAFDAYMKRSISQDKSLRPIVVKVEKCLVQEKKSPSGLLEGEINLGFTFMLDKGDSLVHLLDYQGGARYKRSIGSYSVIASALRQSLASSLRYFNDWMNQQAPNNIKLAKGVKLKIVDYDIQEKGDTVFYHEDRKLKWSDFEARPQPASGYSASIFTSFAWEGLPVVEDGIVELRLITKVFMLKKSSWVRSSTRDTYSLNHEQRHFDITKIIVERFKDKVRQMEFRPETYDGKIGYLYIETYREMNKMQETYDDETDHGKNKAAQERWNKLIDQELEKHALQNESSKE